MDHWVCLGFTLPATCRAADSLDTCPILPKQARPENGEYGSSTVDQSVTFPLNTDPSNSSLLPGSRPLMGKEALQPIGPVSQPEEDPERTKHSKTSSGETGHDGLWPFNDYVIRVLALIFSPLSQEGNRKHRRNSQGSSHLSQGPLGSKVRPQLPEHFWN